MNLTGATNAEEASPSPSGAFLSHLERPLTQLLIIVFVGLLSYSNTFDVPFQFDDAYYIRDNPIIRDLGNFAEHSRVNAKVLYGVGHLMRVRYLGYLSFALNYRINGLDVRGYHLVNLAIHILNALLLRFFLLRTLQTPFLRRSRLGRYASFIAFIAALLFVSHPLQTGAVTYVTQRFASLCAFFYLASLSSYVQARLVEGNVRRYAFYALSLVLALAAMNTKEVAFTLPVAVLLYELLFMQGAVWRRAAAVVPFVLLLSVIPLNVMRTGLPLGEALAEATRTQLAISRGEYFLTQLRVLPTYMRLLLFPVNQNLDYDYPIYSGFSDPEVLVSSAVVMAVFGLLIYLYRLSRGWPELRLVVFGGAFFFLALSVESSVIALADVVFEHRLYLPSAGAFTALVAGGFYMLRRAGRGLRLVAVSLLFVLPAVLASASYARNSQWRTEVVLWQDVVGKSPGKARARNNLGRAYQEAGMHDEAMKELLISVRLEPHSPSARYNLANEYFAAGMTEQAIEQYLAAIEIKPDYADAHYNLADTYRSSGQPERAIKHFQAYLRLRPWDADACINLALIHASLGQKGKALAYLEEADELASEDPRLHWALGLAYEKAGMQEAAEEHFRAASRLAPRRFKWN